jgi:hypothetical protein
MRKYFGTALLLVTFAGGCSKPPLANQPSPLNVEMRRYERVIPGCGDIDKREQPCFSFQVVYPEVTGAGLEETKTRLNAQVRALLQPPGSPEGFENEATALVEKYASREKPLDEEPAWFVRRIAETVHSTAASWSVRVERTEFLGGGSAVSTYECLNLNPASGAEIRLQDLLEKGGLEKLRALAESRFRAERKIPAGGKLSESGYVFAEDRFELPPRFLIGKQGLVFIYSPHEISPEAGGPTYLTLPWAEAGPLLKREAGVVPKI